MRKQVRKGSGGRISGPPGIGTKMKQVFKAIWIGLVAGIVIGGIWNLQDVNYYLGTVVGLVVIAGALVVVSKVGK